LIKLPQGHRFNTPFQEMAIQAGVDHPGSLQFKIL
jgi:hypothetical protein